MSSGSSKAPDKSVTSPPGSPPSRPVRSRNSSVNSLGGRDQYAPTNPSRLRTSIVPDNSAVPDDTERAGFGSSENPVEKRLSVPYVEVESIRPSDPEPASAVENDPYAQAEQPFPSPPLLSERSRLLTSENWDAESGCGSVNCRHGTFSPRPGSPRSYGSIDSVNGFAERYVSRTGTSYNETSNVTNRLLGDAGSDGIFGGGDGRHMSTTQWLAKKHGIKMSWMMYLSYYVPLFNWIQQYRWTYVRGDLVAALTMASFYIPMSLSYASNLGHVPPVSGLYSFVFNPLIYAVLGTCPQMVVGPEAAGSLLTGQVVRENINKGRHNDENDQLNAEVAGIVTFIAGAVILLAGLFRLGFLDNVLSRPFLRGFISAIGIVIFVDQLIPEMGLSELSAHENVAHGSTLDKAIFVMRNIHHSHALTCAVSFGAFAIIMICRELKKRLQPRFPSVAYIPDRFLVVVLSAVFAWRFGWESKGLEVMGNIKAHGKPFTVHFPFDTLMHLQYASDAFSTAFVIALLGFFESSVAAKSLGTAETSGGVLKNINLSANRELVALGVANTCGGLFMALPAFGGYGRSKVNASTGGKTPMSSIFLCIITIICILFLLPYFYYIPKGVLSAMISVVAYSLLEEIPPDLLFFLSVRGYGGYQELLLMTIIFLATIFWNLKVGIAVGIGLSLLRVLRHATRPRIQILGRVPGTSDRFENAELVRGGVEYIEGILIVKIPEPLHFANTGDLRARLRRLEEHGTQAAHPSLPAIRPKEHNKNIVFDVHGVTSMDAAGAQVLKDIVQGYVDKGVRVFFCRVPREDSPVFKLFEKSGIVELVGGRDHFVSDVQQALRMTELEDVEEELRREADAFVEP